MKSPRNQQHDEPRRVESQARMTICKPASLGVQAEVRALEARLRRHGLFGRSLLFDVLADDADRRSATGCSEVGRGPKDSLPIPPHQFGAHLPKASAGHALEAVHQHRHRDLGRVIHQQMDMIVLSIHLDQFSLEIRADLRKDGSERSGRGFAQNPPSVLT